MTYQVRGYPKIFFAVINSSLSWKDSEVNFLSLWVGCDVSWLVTKADILPAFDGNIRMPHFPVYDFNFLSSGWLYSEAVSCHPKWKEVTGCFLAPCYNFARRELEDSFNSLLQTNGLHCCIPWLWQYWEVAGIHVKISKSCHRTAMLMDTDRAWIAINSTRMP